MIETKTKSENNVWYKSKEQKINFIPLKKDVIQKQAIFHMPKDGIKMPITIQDQVNIICNLIIKILALLITTQPKVSYKNLKEVLKQHQLNLNQRKSMDDSQNNWLPPPRMIPRCFTSFFKYTLILYFLFRVFASEKDILKRDGTRKVSSLRHVPPISQEMGLLLRASLPLVL